MPRISKLLPAVLLLCAGLSGCRKAGDPVKETLDGIVAAANKRDAARVVSHLAPGYRDAEDQTPRDVEAVLRRYFSAYEILNVRISGLKIERAPETARARFRADLSGQPVKLSGLDRFFPSASSYDFDVRLSPEGGRWKVDWAAWQEAQ